MPTDLSTRIESIQKQLSVPETGTIDIPTCQRLEELLSVTLNSSNLTTHIKNIQRNLHIDDDGLVGPITVSRIEALIATKLPPIPAGASMMVSQRSLELILESEVSSKETYTRVYQSPVWPGGESGVTIGIGYDLGYMSKQAFTETWGGLLSASDMQTLLPVIGLKGEKAHKALAGCKSVKISYDKAIQVFYHTVLPACAKDTRKALPGVQKLPPDAQGALLSLVYNRGPLINDTDKRKEMKAIVPLVTKGDLAGIAAQLRSMKRLWTAKGLISRREKEAVLTENASTAILPEAIIFV